VIALAVTFNVKEDTRIYVPWGKRVSTKDNFNLLSKTYEALKNNHYQLSEIKARIGQSKSPKQTLDIMQDYVRFG
jgi:ATP-dependent Lon protease